MMSQTWDTGLWRDTVQIPESVVATLDAAVGFGDVAALLTMPGTRRVVVSGNGASYYAAMAMWLAALEGSRSPVEVVPIPAGLLARDAFRWREGDVLLALSSSGESRDLVEAVESSRLPKPFATVTADPSASIPRWAGAVAVTAVSDPGAITHTQAFCGAVVATLAIWSVATQDASLADALAEAPAACERAIRRTVLWAEEAFDSITQPPAAVAFGTGPAWAAALEGALLLKEVSRIPCEGSETREGATTAMTGLLPQHLAISLPVQDDPLIEEAEDVCRSIPCQLLRAPGGEEGDRRLAAVTAFPPMAALGIDLALRGGWDVDNPAWFSRYEATARRTEDGDLASS
jgi:fructoselysine-6-P-deglycase FrlB-like protein